MKDPLYPNSWIKILVSSIDPFQIEAIVLWCDYKHETIRVRIEKAILTLDDVDFAGRQGELGPRLACQGLLFLRVWGLVVFGTGTHVALSQLSLLPGEGSPPEFVCRFDVVHLGVGSGTRSQTILVAALVRPIIHTHLHGVFPCFIEVLSWDTMALMWR